MIFRDTRGKHMAFYYCGIEHMIINLTKYISEGIRNNELICIYCRDSSYESFISFMQNNNLEMKNVVRFSAKPFIIVNREKGVEGLKERIDKFISEAKNKGYSGIRFFGKCRLAIEETSKEDFLNFEKYINEAIKDKDFSVLCAYDFNDFMGGKEFIDQEVIEYSRQTHTHQLYKFDLVPM